jgi:signal transduction histidine kinase
MLATLPLRLDPGVDIAPLLASTELNITTAAVGLAWPLIVFVLAATAMLLRATLDLSERRGAFVSAVTHELRTPLTTFRMYTEMLSEDMVTDEAQRSRYIETLRKEAHRLDNLVENVLTYARIEDERAQVKAETHALGHLVDEISVRLRERAEQAQFEYKVEVDAALREHSLLVDRTALEQVLFNLVDNAAKYRAFRRRNSPKSSAPSRRPRRTKPEPSQGSDWVSLCASAWLRASAVSFATSPHHRARASCSSFPPSSLRLRRGPAGTGSRA